MRWNENSQYVIAKGIMNVIKNLNKTNWKEAFDVINDHLKEFGLEIGPIKGKLCQCPKIEEKDILTSDIGKKVCNILIDKLGLDEREILPQSSLSADLGMDSLDAVEILMDMEREFNISITDEEVETIKTVDDIISLIEEKK
ncbi:MAG: acyl carrier protein [Melioribacteraceae bacterium]